MAALQGLTATQKKGHAPKSTAINTELNDNAFMATCPREYRILRALAQRPHKLRELMSICGANNPAEYVRRMRNRGLPIYTEWQSGTDRDGRNIRFGIYHLLPDDRPRVLAGLEVGK